MCSGYRADDSGEKSDSLANRGQVTQQCGLVQGHKTCAVGEDACFCSWGWFRRLQNGGRQTPPIREEAKQCFKPACCKTSRSLLYQSLPDSPIKSVKDHLLLRFVTALTNKPELSQYRGNTTTSTDSECAICIAYVGAECSGRSFMLDDAIAVIPAVHW